MKNVLIKFLKFSIPIALGLFLIWYIYKDLSEKDKNDIFTSFKEANYLWIGLSIGLGILSNISRALRWLLVIDTLGYKARFGNSFFAVMIGYLINLLVPRLGEVSRCATMAKYEKIPFQNLFGTVMAERVIDMIILLILTFITIFSQLDLIGGFVSTEILNPLLEKLNNSKEGIATKLIIAGIGLLLFIVLLYFLKNKSNAIYLKIKAVLSGFADGFKTVLKVKKPGLFIFHTLFIWLMYYVMLHVCFFALKETTDASVMAVLSSMVFGAFGIIAVQGGLGAYPLIISKTLILFGIAKTIGLAFGWIVWTAQFFMILSMGLLSMIMIPNYNKTKSENEL